MPETAAAAAALPVLTPDGAEVRLGEAWATKPVVLALMRHFGCIFCKDHVARLKPIIPRIHQAGAELVIVGNGLPQFAKFFAEDYGIDTPLFTDPTLRVYEALEAHRPGWLAAVHPLVMLRAFRAMLRGRMQGRTQGDVAQLGGVFIILPDGSMPYAYRSRLAGDLPANDEVLAQLRRAVSR